MRRYLALLLLPLFSYASCKKPQKLDYAISATSDSTSTENKVTVTVSKAGGDDDFVYLSVEDLPSYITAEVSPLGQKPPYTATITFKLGTIANQNISTWKSYTATINGRSGAGVTKTCQTTFTCNPFDATQAFNGHTFFGLRECMSSGYDTTSVSTLAEGGDQILLVNFYNTLIGSFSLPATVDGINRTISIPPYTESGITFRGTGTFYSVGGDSLGCTIHYSRTTASSFDTCTTTFVQLF